MPTSFRGGEGVFCQPVLGAERESFVAVLAVERESFADQVKEWRGSLLPTSFSGGEGVFCRPVLVTERESFAD